MNNTDATVIRVDAGLIGHGGRGDYTYMSFHYQPDDHPQYGHQDPAKKNVFENMDIYAELAKLTAGDRVHIEFVKQDGSRYYNISRVTKLADQVAPQPQQQSQASGGTGGTPRPIYEDRKSAVNRSIERQVSLKAAVELLVATAKKGASITGEAVKALAEEIDTYFTKKKCCGACKGKPDDTKKEQPKTVDAQPTNGREEPSYSAGHNENELPF